MLIGICGKPEDVPAVEGLDYVEPTVADVLCPLADEDAFEARLAELAALPRPVLAANCFIPGDLKTTGPDVRPRQLDAFVRTALNRAARAGVKVIVFGSGGSRRVPEDWDPRTARAQLIEHLGRWGPAAATAGVVIALEPLNKGECNIVNGVDEGAAIVREVGLPGIRLLVDTYHMARDGDDVNAIRRAGDLIVHVHVAENAERGPLGQAGEDMGAYFQALAEVGYDGGISIEARWSDLSAQAAGAVAELRRQWNPHARAGVARR